MLCELTNLSSTSSIVCEHCMQPFPIGYSSCKLLFIRSIKMILYEWSEILINHATWQYTKRHEIYSFVRVKLFFIVWYFSVNALLSCLFDLATFCFDASLTALELEASHKIWYRGISDQRLFLSLDIMQLLLFKSHVAGSLSHHTFRVILRRLRINSSQYKVQLFSS